MLTKRIIPCLDVTQGRVVKGTSFTNLRDAGDPVELADFYYREGADELVFLDIGATPEGRGTMVDIVERCSEQVFNHQHRRRKQPGAHQPGGGKVRRSVYRGRH